MELDDRDLAYLWDMLEYARHVAAILAGKSKQDWEKDITLRLAVERGLEIIGEAARRISDRLKKQRPDIPWKDIIGQRNILAHDYGNIDYDLLYRTAVRDVPALIDELSELLPPPPEEEN